MSGLFLYLNFNPNKLSFSTKPVSPISLFCKEFQSFNLSTGKVNLKHCALPIFTVYR